MQYRTDADAGTDEKGKIVTELETKEIFRRFVEVYIV